MSVDICLNKIVFVLNLGHVKYLSIDLWRQMMPKVHAVRFVSEDGLKRLYRL